MSVEPPGWNGTITRTGRIGHVCARALPEAAENAAAPTNRYKNRRRGGFTARA